MYFRVAVILLAGLLITAGCATSPTRDDAASPTHSGDTAKRTDAARPDAAATTPPAGTAPGRVPSDLPRLPVPPAAASPASEGDYLLAPRDQVSVQVFGQDDFTRTVRVDQDGKIVLPLIGSVEVGGLTPQAAQERIEDQLKKGGYLINPKVTVAVTEYQGRQYAVVGGVNQPGTYTLRSSQVGIMSAISEARGVRENAEPTAYIVRGKPRPDEAQPLRVDLTLLNSGEAARVMVEAGDVVYVPEDNTFYITGEVEKRGAYTVRRDMTLSKAITEAGGVTRVADQDRISVIRTMPDGDRKEISGISLEAIRKGDRAADLKLQTQDVIVVPASGAKTVGYGFLDFLKGVFSIGAAIPLF